jgi:outer membrane receptor protein involved in Fe transport
MKLVKLNIAIIILLLVKTVAYSQGSGKISGNAKDSVSHENISYATVTLTDPQTRAPVKATQTDSNGNFVLENLPNGTFTLRISYVGYQDIVRADIMVSAATGNLNLGDLLMNASKSNSLKEVVVTAKKDALLNIDGKKVFAVNQSLVSKSGNAADLLQNVPTLQIDGNGNVSLRGSTGVKVLVDGKPTVIADGDVTQILQSIPASAIETIEVIPNPSARYDANGEGIINIILKKNSKPGLNGSVNLGGGTRDNYYGSANLSYQTGKVNLYGNYSIKNGNTYSNGFQYMTFLKPTDSIRYSNETFPSVTRNKIQFLKGGIDYSLTSKSTLGISGSLNSRKTHRDEVLSIDNLAENSEPLNTSNRYNTTNNNGNSYELGVDYDQHFKKAKEELTFNFSYAYGSFRNWQEYKTHINSINGQPVSLIDTPLISDIRNKATNYNIQADYVLPLGKAGQFSAGYRSQITLGNNDQYASSVTGMGTSPLYAFTSFFSSNNQVHAVYVNYQDQIANFSYQLGLRAEDSHLNATFMSYDANNSLFAEPVKVPSVGLYPSVLLTEKLENNSQLQFTFTNRVSRPTARELNSATDFSDPVNYERGNPGLTPESISSLELGYNKTWQNISFTSAIYYNRINNVIKHIESYPIDGIVITTAQNLKRSTTTGLELIGHFDVVKGWDFTANANIYERDNDAAPQFGIAQNTSLSWNANVTNNITLLQKLSFQIRADYRAPDMIVQDKNHSAFGMDAAAKYDFPGNKASLSFNANDVFNSRKWAFLRSSDDLLLDFERRTISSRATLTFTYRFGSGPGSSKQPRKKEAQRDKRIDDAS